MIRIARWAAALGLCLALAGPMAASAAFADDWRDNRYGREIRSDYRDVRESERRIRDLEQCRDQARRRGDWEAVRRLTRLIGEERRELIRDRREFRTDLNGGWRDRDERWERAR